MKLFYPRGIRRGRRGGGSTAANNVQPVCVSGRCSFSGRESLRLVFLPGFAFPILIKHRTQRASEPRIETNKARLALGAAQYSFAALFCFGLLLLQQGAPARLPLSFYIIRAALLLPSKRSFIYTRLKL